MKRLAAITFSTIIFVLAAATIVEKLWDTDTAYQTIYGSVWFKVLWGVLCLCGIHLIYNVKMWKCPAALLFHISFMVILLGALVTSLTATEQILHIRVGEDSGAALPFTLRLDSFELKKYAATELPRDYVSHVTYQDDEQAETYDISMNHILSHRGYRFYQTSYDGDLKGTILTVRHDPWGVGITYTGYALLLISMLWLILTPHGTFRTLLRSVSARGLLTIALLVGMTTIATAQKVAPPRAISAEKAETMARKQVVYNGRITPIRTQALDFCMKVTGRRNFGGLSAERLMLSLMLYPEDWQHVKMIKVEGKELRERLGIDGTHAAMADLFNADGSYRLASLYQAHKDKGDKMEDYILRTDERMELIMSLLTGKLVSAVPQGVERPSEALVTAELIYDYAPWSLILFISAFLISVMQLILLFMKRRKKISFIANLLTLLISLSLTALFILRWAIQGHVPMSNGYETMLFIALTASVIAAALAMRRPRHTGLLTALSLLVCTFALLVSHLSFMSPAMTPLMPVLQSPLLTIHVSVIMLAYALLAILTLISISALIVMWTRRGDSTEKIDTFEGLTLVSRLILIPAVFLLTAGIFLGAVWANISWGTYWSWDPKETWALITMMIYAVPLHRDFIKIFRSPSMYHAYMTGAFLSVLITYFGVNYLLGGMHSYA